MGGAAAFGLTLAELCDVVYVVLWQEYERVILAGGSDPREQRAAFDAWLCDQGPASKITPDELAYRRALGVA